MSAPCWAPPNMDSGAPKVERKCLWNPQQVHIINADQGGEAINTDFTTLQGISLGFTGRRWAQASASVPPPLCVAGPALHPP